MSDGPWKRDRRSILQAVGGGGHITSKPTTVAWLQARRFLDHSADEPYLSSEGGVPSFAAVQGTEEFKLTEESQLCTGLNCASAH